MGGDLPGGETRLLCSGKGRQGAVDGSELGNRRPWPGHLVVQFSDKCPRNGMHEGSGVGDGKGLPAWGDTTNEGSRCQGAGGEGRLTHGFQEASCAPRARGRALPGPLHPGPAETPVRQPYTYSPRSQVLSSTQPWMATQSCSDATQTTLCLSHESIGWDPQELAVLVFRLSPF